MLVVDLYCLPLTNHRGSLNSSLPFLYCFQCVKQLYHLTSESLTCKYVGDI